MMATPVPLTRATSSADVLSIRCQSCFLAEDFRPTGRANIASTLADTVAGEWWVEEDLNLRPHAYQACALTT